MLPFLRWVKNNFVVFSEGNRHSSIKENKSGKKEKLEPFMLSGFQLFNEAYVILNPEQVPSALCQCRGIRLPGLHQKLRNQ